MNRFMYPGDPRLQIVNEMSVQMQLFIGPEGYQEAKALAYVGLYSGPATKLGRMAPSCPSYRSGEW